MSLIHFSHDKEIQVLFKKQIRDLQIDTTNPNFIAESPNKWNNYFLMKTKIGLYIFY